MISVHIWDKLPHHLNGVAAFPDKITMYKIINISFCMHSIVFQQASHIEHHYCGAPVKSSSPTNQHSFLFLQSRCPSCRPTNSFKALKGNLQHVWKVKLRTRASVHMEPLEYKRTAADASHIWTSYCDVIFWTTESPTTVSVATLFLPETKHRDNISVTIRVQMRFNSFWKD